MMSDRPELPGKADYSIAFRAIALAEGLSGDAKRVAAIIVGHFNTKTGQCDPGTERLMSKANVSKRTVVNATNDLHRLGLVVKVRHGGNGFRSRYQPNWSRFREIVEASNDDENAAETVQKRALTKCKSVHLDSAKACTLTNNRNLSKELTPSDGASGGICPSVADTVDRPVSADRVERLMSESVRKMDRRTLTPPSVASAHHEAWTRIEAWLTSLGPTMRETIERFLPSVRHEAIIAELKTPGAGRDLIWTHAHQTSATAGRR